MNKRASIIKCLLFAVVFVSCFGWDHFKIIPEGVKYFADGSNVLVKEANVHFGNAGVGSRIFTIGGWFRFHLNFTTPTNDHSILSLSNFNYLNQPCLPQTSRGPKLSVMSPAEAQLEIQLQELS
eukprot:TRINITY_DN2052_c0_g1_i1.p2 TRINITY_DN2052_c0_g1~~TRINITY_DN2052_c0_g1_i1.p2  ORF type:complete len:124 (+),score=9.24 TRINITY_DN2052_c0_g1_i1:20-391(+)